MLKIIDFIKTNDNWRELLSGDPYNLLFDETEDYLLLKYTMGVSKFSNPIVQECRGLILKKKDWTHVCVPFYKFFNYGESNAHELDWDSVEFQDKIDGSIIKLWYDEDWRVSTNGKIDASQARIEDLTNNPYKTFADLFLQAWIKNNGDLRVLDKDNTYMFELATPYNRVVVTHNDFKLYHIGTRNNKTLQEINVDIGIQKPKKYPFKTLQECIDIAKDLPYDEEGYIAVDKNFNRVKIKSPSYVAMHHVVSKISSKRNIMEVILKGEMDEVLNYFPEFKDAFLEIYEAWEHYMDFVSADIWHMEDFNMRKLDRKQFAGWAKECTNPSVMFKLYDDKDFDWGKMITETPVKRLLQMIGIKE